METRDILVKCFDDAVESKELYRITAQTYELKREDISDDTLDLGNELNIFPYTDPAELDILTLVSLDVERDSCLRWTVQESDVPSCIGLGNPRKLEPLVEVSSSTYPALSLMDKLAASGFSACRHRIFHEKDAPSLFDERSAAGRVAYLQCLYLLCDLLRGGLLSFPSHECQAYYRVLLRDRKPLPAGKGAKAYKKMLSGTEDDALKVALASPAVAGRMSRKRRAPEPTRPIASGSEVAGDDSPCAISIDSDVAHWVEGVEEGSGSGESVAGDEAPLPEFVREILGAAVKHVPGRKEKEGGYNYSDRLYVKCTNCDHEGCGRSRSNTLQVAELGPLAAQWFLGAWLEKSTLHKSKHRAFQPSLSDIRAYKARCEMATIAAVA